MTPAPVSGGRLFLVLAAALAGALWLLDAATAGDLALGQGAAHAVIETAAITATALFAITLIARVILAIAPMRAGGAPNGLQRFVVYALVTFPVAFFTLQHFGFNLGAVLAGSAIATAAVGLAMQPTLGSMISGLTLQLDRVLREGDSVIHDGEPVRLLRLDWRTAVGRKADGRLVVFPNARLSDAVLEVLPQDGPQRSDIAFQVGLGAPPQRVCDIARELVSDFALVDTTRPILVAPTGFESGRARYRIRFWTRFHWRSSLIEGEVLRRLWYAFQRHGVPLEAEEAAAAVGPDEIAQALAAATGPAADWAAATAAEAGAGRVLMFAPDERLVMPDWAEGWRFLMLRGEAAEAPEFEFVQHAFDATPPLAVERLGRHARVQKIAEALSDRIGPYAEYAVARAAERIADIDGLSRAVALEIDDEAARAAFLQAVRVGPEPASPVDRVLTVRRNAAGALVARGNLRALTEVVVLARPPQGR